MSAVGEILPLLLPTFPRTSVPPCAGR